MAWALHAASRGLSEQQLRNEILDARDLSKKGGRSRQIDYAARTAIKALSTVRRIELAPLGCQDRSNAERVSHENGVHAQSENRWVFRYLVSDPLFIKRRIAFQLDDL
jgi:hypothetical protein